MTERPNPRPDPATAAGVSPDRWPYWPVLVLVVLAVLIAAERWTTWRRVNHNEAQRLQTQVQWMGRSVSAHLAQPQAALQAWARAHAGNAPLPDLALLAQAVPGVFAVAEVDAQGRVRASSRPAWVGKPWSGGPVPMLAAGQGLLQVVPRLVEPGVRGLPMWWPQPDGSALVAVLDPGDLGRLLRPLSEPSMPQAALLRRDGLAVDAEQHEAGQAWEVPQALLQSAVALGASAASPAQILRWDEPERNGRLLALQPLEVPGVALDEALFVAAWRDRWPWERLWWRNVALFAAFYLVVSLSWMGLLAQRRRRQRAWEAEQAERQQQERIEAERLRLALQGADLALWDADLLTGVGTVNDRWYQMLGYTPEQVGEGHGAWEALIHPQDLAMVRRALDEHIAGRTELFEVQYRLRHHAGHWLWVLDRGQVVTRDGEGRALRMVGTHLDITDRVRGEQVLRDREALLRQITDALPGPVARLDRGGRYLFANAAYKAWFGLDPEAMIGRTRQEVHRREAFLQADADIRRALAGEMRVFVDEVPTQHGPRTTQVALLPDRDSGGAVRGVFVILTDMQARQQAERQLRLMQAALDDLNDLVIITAAATDPQVGPPIIYVNAAFERHTGWTLDEVRGRSPHFLLGPQTDRTESARVEAELAAGRPVRTELIHHRRDGRPYWADISLVPLRDEFGRLSHAVSVHRDISERQAAVQQLREARETLAATLSAVPDLLFVMDGDGRIINQHSPRTDLLLMPPAALLNRCFDEVLPAPAASVVREALAQALREGYSGGLQYELVIQEQSHWFELSVATQQQAGGGVHYVALARDVSERRRADAQRRELERQLREAQRIEAVGRLAGGIAHDFNNILAAVLGSADLLAGDLSREHPAQRLLTQIRMAGLRGRELVQQILTFSRQAPRSHQPLALQPLMDEALDLLALLLPPGVTLQRHYSRTPLWLATDATEMHQILMNLGKNAQQALGEQGGTVEFGCELLLDEVPPQPRAAELALGPCIHLWVRDDGAGMDKATRDRIFDPFFTTKPVGQGTGLGLSVVHGLVRGHQGSIRVDSELGQGTTFHLYFPVIAPPTEGASGEEAEADRQPDAQTPVDRATGDGQQVLYVDDDEVLLLVVQRLLERAGYVAVVCAGVDQALAHLRAEPERYDVLVTDFNMPYRDGLDLVAAARDIRADLPAVLTSGYIDDTLRERATRLGVVRVLRKEALFDELAPAVAATLAERDALRAGAVP